MVSVVQMWRKIAAALLLLAAVPAGAQEAPTPRAESGTTPNSDGGAFPRPDGGASPRPAIWLLADEDTRIYLFGTIHILPPGLNWRSPAIERAIGEADELVLEVDDEQMANAGMEMFTGTLLGKEVPVAWRVSPDRRETLAEMIAESGMSAESLAPLQTWAVAMSLSVAEIARSYGVEPTDMAGLTGVEEALTEDFQRRGRPISGVETVAEQLGFFSRMSQPAQRAMLEEMIDAYASGEGGFEPGEDGWVRGDLDGLADELAQMPPELYEALLTRRNAAWTGWLIDRLERPGTILFAVGAGHLVGADSVQSMLAARGLRVTRVD